MIRIFNVFVLTLLLLATGRSSTAAEDPIELDAVLESWDVCINRMSQIGGFEFRALPPATESQANPILVSSCQIDGDYGIKKTIANQRGVETEYLFISNPYYIAQLKPAKDGWLLEFVHSKENKITYDKERREQLTELIFGSVFNFISIEQLRNCEDCATKQLSSGLIEFVFSDVDDSGRLKQAVVTVDPSRNFMPVSVLLDYGKTARLKTFSGWIEVDGIPCWTKEVSSIPDNYDSAGLSVEFHTNFDALERKPIRKHCFLSHYGLPEPEGVGGSIWAYWPYVLLVLAAIASMYWVKRSN